MFLTIGFVAAAARLSGPVALLAGALALSLAGLPFTGGALAKLAVEGDNSLADWPAFWPLFPPSAPLC